MEYKDPVGLERVFDVEYIVGALGWSGADEIVRAVDSTDIENKDKWVISLAVEMGYDAGRHDALSSAK